MTIVRLKLFHTQKHRAQNPCLLDINSINPHKSIDNRLAAVDQERIGKADGDDLHGHAGFDADAVELCPRLGRNQEFGHMVISYIGLQKRVQ